MTNNQKKEQVATEVVELIFEASPLYAKGFLTSILTLHVPAHLLEKFAEDLKSYKIRSIN